jgi:hypothetical protein
MKYEIQITDEEGNVQCYILRSSYIPQSKSLDDFILEALQISDDKRKLPLKIQCSNGLEVYPTLKMKFKDFGIPMPGDKIESLHISWQG